MTVELRPLGVACNIMCHYCYQHPQRDAGAGGRRRYDMAAMKRSIEELGGPFALFGGEPLLVPIEDLEQLWAWGFERWGQNALQTNGTLLTEAHLELIRRYRVKVGLSLDGPADLNDVRWAGSLERTRAHTATIEGWIERLCAEGLAPQLILTLHRHNAHEAALPRLAAWLRRMDGLGVRRCKLHALEEEDNGVGEKLALDTEQNRAAFRFFAALEPTLPRLRFDLFEDMRRQLRADDDGTGCIWNSCDPYTTRAVQGVEGDGQKSNCGRSNKEGIDFVKADAEGYQRQVALYHSPQESGGCAGCRFFVVCKGNCPGTAEQQDWRRRSQHCDLWKDLLGAQEEALLARGAQPISLDPRRPRVERALLAAWASGTDRSVGGVVAALEAGTALPDVDLASPEGLGFRIPDFVRLSWVSERARTLWAPQLKRAAGARRRLALHAVARGLQPSARLAVGLSLLPGLRAEADALGLTLAVEHMGMAPRGSGELLQARLSVQPGSAAPHADDVPACCRAHGGTHPEPEWALPAALGPQPAWMNPSLRPLGLFILPWTPCGPGCRASAERAQALASLAHEVGLAEDWEVLEEALQWPMEWTALHGIAEVRTPLFRFAGAVRATSERVRHIRRGSVWPVAGAVGLRFPYQRPKKRSLTRSRRFLGGAGNPLNEASAMTVLQP